MFFLILSQVLRACFTCEKFDHLCKNCILYYFSGASKVVNFLQDHGKQVIFVTNNSTKSRAKYAVKLKRLGFPADKEKIFGTAYTSAIYLRDIAKVC